MPSNSPIPAEQEETSVSDEFEITEYEVGEIEDDSTEVRVSYRNQEGFIHERSVNIPRKADGSIDQEYFDEILEGQLRGVNAKLKLGVANFADPNAVDEADIVPEEEGATEDGSPASIDT